MYVGKVIYKIARVPHHHPQDKKHIRKYLCAMLYNCLQAWLSYKPIRIRILEIELEQQACV